MHLIRLKCWLGVSHPKIAENNVALTTKPTDVQQCSAEQGLNVYSRYVIERTRGAVGYGGKPKFPHECAARVGNRGWSPMT